MTSEGIRDQEILTKYITANRQIQNALNATMNARCRLC